MMIQRHRHGFVILSVLLTILIIIVILHSVLLRTRLNLALVGDRADALQLRIFHESAIKWVRKVLYQDQQQFSVSSFHSLIATPLHDMPVGPGFLSGYIEDAQSKWNVNNLFLPGGRVDPDALAIMKRILLLDHCSADLADVLVAWHVKHPQDMLLDFDQLSEMPGFSQVVLQQIQPDLTVLPEATLVNVNTATMTVIQALMPTAPADECNALMIQRATAPIVSLERVNAILLQVSPHIIETSLTLKSDYFLLHGRARLRTVISEASVLFRRIVPAMPIVVWQRFSY